MKGGFLQGALHINARWLRLLGSGAIVAAASLAILAGSAQAAKPSVTSKAWGAVDGQPVTLYSLRSGNGMTVKITNYGGVIQSILVPDRKGNVTNVALGFPKLADYVNDFTQGATSTPWPLAGGSGDTYFGAIIGRYANRIANASFDLNGKTYKLDANNGPNTLHGGYLGWNTRVWKGSTSACSRRIKACTRPSPSTS